MLKNFRIQVIFRTLLLAATLYALLSVINQTGPPLVGTLLGIAILILVQLSLLVRYVETTNCELVRFFDSIRNADFSQTFTSSAGSAAHRELSRRFSEVMEAFRQARSATEEHLRYVDAVVQHVGIGLISFEQNGEVELINNAAKRLLNIPQLRNIQSLKSISEPLALALTGMKAGENDLVKLTIQGVPMQLALHAMEFRMKDRSYMLISLQNIQGELERERMSKELEIARELQQRLLPKRGVEVGPYDIAGVCIPAEEVGGDYFDYVQLKDKKTGIIIGDVSGKGVPAAIYMTLAKGITQACASHSSAPKEVLASVNGLMYGTIERGSFVTMAYAALEPNGRPSIVARAGHTPVIHFDAKKRTCSILESKGLALGLMDEATFSASINEREIALQSGDLLVFYTDGVTESMNTWNEEFGLDRLQNSVQAHASLASQGIVDALCSDVKEFTGGNASHDDMTIVVVKKK